jgi:arabinogalactan oligomer/maltooligosaccharide transport system permease protein
MTSEKRLPIWKQLLLQAVALFVAFTVLVPILWVVSMSLDPRDIARPTEFTLIPPGASFDAYLKVLDRPTANPVTFTELLINQLKLAGGVSFFSVLIGVFAAYAFSRIEFAGRRFLMIAMITVLMLPGIATIAPLFALLSRISVQLGEIQFNLRNSLLGVGLAMVSGSLPFSIWNLKGYLDTIPRELEEAAKIDGAGPNQTFFYIVLPLAVPALAVVAFLGFLGGWTEFALSWMFLTKPQDFTLAMSLYNMVGQYSDNTPWSLFSAMALMIATPVAVVYMALQRYIVSGLTIGGVK